MSAKMKNPSRLILVPAWAFSRVRFMSKERHLELRRRELARREASTLRARENAVRDAKSRAIARIPKKKEVLSERLLKLGGGSVVLEALSRYVTDRKVMKLREIELCLTEFCDQKRHGYALAIFQWMENAGFPLTYANRALRVDLTSKVQGIDAAEQYFNEIPTPEKTQLTYGALLKCYSDHEMPEEAVLFFQNMETLGFLSSSAFETLIYLHTKMNQPENIPPLIQKMQDGFFSITNTTYSCWMKSCASLDDLKGLRKILREMEMDRVNDWGLFSELAEIYIKAGKLKKADIALRDLEDLKPTDRKAYHSLIRLYASTSNLDGVKRTWETLTTHFKRKHSCFLTMILALAKLDDTFGLTACFREWASHFKRYDLNVANAAIGAYLRWGKLDIAEEIFCGAKKYSCGPFTRTRILFVNFFIEKRNVKLGLEHLDAAVSEVGVDDWKNMHPLGLVKAFFEGLEEEKDVDGAEELCEILKKVDCLDCDAYEGLIRVYVGAGKVAAGMRRRMEEDGIEISPVLEKLLQTCGC